MSLATSNAFAALDTKRKKKTKPKEETADKKKKHPAKAAEASADLEKAVFSQPKINVSNWADTDEEEDDFGDGVGDNKDPWVQVSPRKHGSLCRHWCRSCPPISNCSSCSEGVMLPA